MSTFILLYEYLRYELGGKQKVVGLSYRITKVGSKSAGRSEFFLDYENTNRLLRNNG